MNKLISSIRLKRALKTLNIKAIDPLREDYLAIKTFMYVAYAKSEWRVNQACILEECFFAVWRFWDMPLGEQLGRSIGKLSYLLSKKFKTDEMSLILTALDRYKYYDSIGSQNCISEFAKILAKALSTNTVEENIQDKTRFNAESQQQDGVFLYACAFAKGLGEELKRA